MTAARTHKVGTGALQTLIEWCEAEMDRRGNRDEWLAFTCLPESEDLLQTDYDWPLRCAVWLGGQETSQPTKAEKTERVRLKAQHIKELDDACPDVGMGMSWMTACKEASAQLGYKPDEIDWASLGFPKANVKAMRS